MSRLSTLLITALLCLLANTGIAQPKAKLWDIWAVSDPRSTLTVDHSPWQDVLNRNLRGYKKQTRFAYALISDQDRKVLEDYLASLSKVRVSYLAQAEQLPFWINLYNALTVQVILDHYPIDSIFDIDISPGLFSNGPWGKKLVVIEGAKIGLDDIEHRILRPIWRDPRIHYAVNCASIGCPNLSPVAFTTDNTEAQLNYAAKLYINHPRGIKIKRGKLYTSSIYEWFREDFGDTDRQLIEHLNAFTLPELRRKLIKIKKVSDSLEYDWGLNGVQQPQ